jgi:hypothetical protein
MISLCQVGQGFPVGLRRRLVVSLSMFITSRLCLSTRFLRVTQNQTSIRCIGLLRPSQKIERVFPASPETFRRRHWERSSVAQSASAGPGRLRSMNLLVLRSGFRPLLFVLLPLRTLVHCGPPQGDRRQASGRQQSRLDWHGPSAFPCHRPTPVQGSSEEPV